MSDLNEFLQVLAEAKKHRQEEVVEVQKGLGDFLAAVAEAKAIDPKHQRLKEVKKHIQEDVGSLFAQLGASQPIVVKEPDTTTATTIIGQAGDVQVVGDCILVEGKLIPSEEYGQLKEAVPVPQAKPASQIHSQPEIDKYLRRNASFQQPDPEKVDPNITAIRDKLKFLEQAIGRIAATGPGGGAGEIYNLDMPTRQVTGDYTIGRKDYYVGVNGDVKTYITLPTPGQNLKNGRVVVIKDESGHAQLTPIKIIGTIDNDPNGAEIRINNGALQLLYRDGSWRII